MLHTVLIIVKVSNDLHGITVVKTDIMSEFQSVAHLHILFILACVP